LQNPPPDDPATSPPKKLMQSPSRGIDIKGSSNNARSNHRRNQSLPPFEVLITPPSSLSASAGKPKPNNKVADDPWSFFITPASQEDLFFDTDVGKPDWDAGIAAPPKSGYRPIRKGTDYFFQRWDSFIAKRQELANNPPHRYVDNDIDPADENEAYIWPNTVEAETLDRTPSPDPNHRRPKSLTDNDDPYRDHRERRARKKYKRTLSGHRHSWHEPSPDLFPVSETASEYRADEDRMSLDGEMVMSRSAVELGERAKL
jgi:hypothetical protein